MFIPFVKVGTNLLQLLPVIIVFVSIKRLNFGVFELHLVSPPLSLLHTYSRTVAVQSINNNYRFSKATKQDFAVVRCGRADTPLRHMLISERKRKRNVYIRLGMVTDLVGWYIF